MAAPNLNFPGPALELFAAAQAAVAQIPPAFPLAATVAVNPFLGQTGETRAVTAARMARVAGLRIFPARNGFATRIAAGEITQGDLTAAAAAHGISVHDLRNGAMRAVPVTTALPTVADLAHSTSSIGWPEFLSDRIGAWASVHFDQGQAFWPAPDLPAFAAWKAFASRDLTPGIAGLTGFAAYVATLPDDPRIAFLHQCETLGLTPDTAPVYFHRLLMTLEGWGQYARHIGWLAERDGGTDDTLFQMLTIRLVWEAALHERFRALVQDDWRAVMATYAEPITPTQDHVIDATLQEASDRAAERALSDRIVPAQGAVDTDRPAIQAAFCIDVRSEVFRRALELADSGIRTKGFAGFFGLATKHRAHGSDLDEARAPVLLRPGLTTSATDPVTETATRIARRGTRAWGRFKMAAVSAFAFVEAAGPLYIGKLLRDAVARPRSAQCDPAPQVDLPLSDRIAAAAAVLRAMSLTDGFARLILIAGHGATVTNAPHASALQCGACGGHAGDVNARLLAALLNDPQVRDGLLSEGITIPQDSVFVAGLHDTVSDEVTLFDLPKSTTHAPDLARLRSALKLAGQTARGERARLLPRGTAATLPARGGDWSELRPEWGLAGCNAFVAAPRRVTAGGDLSGRVFLHDYDWQADRDFATLELILTAPVVVASWISLQYYGSSVAPQAFGAGNKLLHNVTGGIGVVEGNGGMLRAGLPLQSVHDGDTLRHTPDRLSVVMVAPAHAISAVLTRHAGLRDLFDNGWLALLRMDDAGVIVERYEDGTWLPFDTPQDQARVA